MSYAIRQRCRAIMDRVNRASQWPWRAQASEVIAPAVPADGSRSRLDWEWYGGELVCESVGSRNADLIERAPEDLAYLCALVSELLEDRHRVDFLLNERFACSSREEVDRLMITNGQPWEPLAIVQADYEIVDETMERVA